MPQRERGSWGGTWAVALGLAALVSSGGCELFAELEDPGGSDGSDATDTSDASDDDDDGDCTYVDDYCSSQDVLESCNPDTRETSTIYCPDVCGSNLNFTCIEASGGQHGCWCVVPGKTSLDGCADLERCLADCGSSESCTESCFGRADAATIRLYGALIHCAEDDCKDLCDEAPDACASCVVSTKSGLYGDCSVARAACDQNDVEEFPWPY